MNYMDDKDKKLQEQMRQEGKVRVPGFHEMVKKYFKSKYAKEGSFEFLYVKYEFYDKDYKIYNLELGEYVPRPQNREIRELLPFFVEPNSIDDARMFSLQIPGLIDVNNLNSEISSRLPNGVTLITDDQIKEILLNEGYSEPFFDHYFYSMMDYPSYNLYAKPITKDKTSDLPITDDATNSITDFSVLSGKSNSNASHWTLTSIADEDISKKLEQAYLDGKLNQTGVIDTENFPQDIPDQATCEILDDLLSQNQLPFVECKYCIGNISSPTYTTDYLKEYSFDGRKFVRYQSTCDAPKDMVLSNGDTINKDQYYWIEVKPVVFDKCLMSGTIENGRKK